jgi:hypothetical protein
MKAAAAQIAFRYRPQDSATGVTRTTTKRLADVLGVDETQVIHLALHELATKFLPQYEADEGALPKPNSIKLKNQPPRPKAALSAAVCLNWKTPDALVAGTHGWRNRLVPFP